jgi:hypothetical protein
LEGAVIKSNDMARVRWEIDVPGATPEEAAFNALKLMQNKDTTALVFSISVRNGMAMRDVDLEQFAVCDNCGELVFIDGAFNRLAEINNLFHRIEPGGMVPSCECPKCGSLAYPAREMARKG